MPAMPACDRAVAGAVRPPARPAVHAACCDRAAERFPALRRRSRGPRRAASADRLKWGLKEFLKAI